MAKHYALWPSRYSDCTDPEKLNMMPFVNEDVSNFDKYSLERYTRLCYEHLEFAFQKQHSFRRTQQQGDSLAMTTSLSQSQLPSASPPPSTFVMRTRAAVLADQSPEGDWVTVDGEQSEESYADLFLLSGLGLSLGIFLVIIYAIFRTPSDRGSGGSEGLKTAMMGLHETMAATALVERQQAAEAAEAAARRTLSMSSSSRDAARARAMMQESLCWQETHSSSVSRANSLAAGKSTASRQPSRESAGGSSSGANVVENYNYDAAPVHHGGGQRGQLQKHQSLYHSSEDERIRRLRKINSMLGQSVDSEKSRGGARNQSFDASGHHSQRHTLHHKRNELRRQQTINQTSLG